MFFLFWGAISRTIAGAKTPGMFSLAIVKEVLLSWLALIICSCMIEDLSVGAESQGTICLVFDAMFALIFALSGLNASAYSAETLCYEKNGYSWHNILVVISVPSEGVVFPSREKKLNHA